MSASLDISRVLHLWYILELLASKDISDQLREPSERITRADTKPLNWQEVFERLDRRIISQDDKEATRPPLRPLLYLGIFSIAPVIAAACTALGVPLAASADVEGRTALASFRLTHNGRYAKGSLTLSALPLAVGLLETESKQDRLNQAAFSTLLEKAQARAERWLSDSGLLESPIRHADLVEFEAFLRESTGCSSIACDELARVLERYGASENASENDDDLLNSFFLADVECAAREHRAGRMPSLLAAFFEDVNLDMRRDHTDNRYETSDLLQPENWARGAWPNTSYTPILMQEAAVSLARTIADSATPSRIVAVNGPPGTGKTTLLRSFIADRLLERARNMAAYDDPQDAFSAVAADEAKFEGYSSRVFIPAENICGYEMVVATMNNRAAENISDDLPAKSSIFGYEDAIESVDLHCVTASAIAAHRGRSASSTWGLIAASLGNKNKRQRFMEPFWWAKKGTSLPDTLASDMHSETLLDWKQTRDRFLDVLKTLEEKIRLRQRFAALIAQTREHEERFVVAERELASLRETIRSKDAALEEAQLKNLLEIASYTRAQERLVERIPFSWLRAIAATSLGRQPRFAIVWEEASRLLGILSPQERNEHRTLRRTSAAVRECLHSLQGEHDELQAAVKRAQENVSRYRDDVLGRRQTIAEAITSHALSLDPSWWQRPHAEIQEQVPFLDAEIIELRRRAFIEALRVHRAFIQGAWKKIKPTLGSWANLLGGRSGFTRPETIAAIWRTAFLVVPVISTTFASVGRMLRDVPPETFGWTIIDEAGQAIPQAAVGLFRRCRRALIVGDPSQILPVVPLGERLVRALRLRCEVHAQWVADGEEGASLQTLADRVSPHGATRMTSSTGEKTWIGLPLYIHRRCVDPMFRVANTIAYDGMMINRTAGDTAAALPLPSSRWIDVTGHCDDGHIVLEQIAYARRMIQNMRTRLGRKPNLYIITPFRDIAKIARTQLADVGLRDSDIGTIHTFQGKEAEIVLLLLGLDARNGNASVFATKRSNVLNVALTRAKHRCYIIGSVDVWGERGSFAVARKAFGVSAPADFEAEMNAMPSPLPHLPHRI